MSGFEVDHTQRTTCVNTKFPGRAVKIPHRLSKASSLHGDGGPVWEDEKVLETGGERGRAPA